MAKKPLTKKTPVQEFLDEHFEPTIPAANSNTTNEPAKEPAAAGSAPERLCGLKVHPAANEFPMLDGDEQAEMVESIRHLGQTTPVVVDGDTLLEGRNRALAVEILQSQGHKIELLTVQWQPTRDCPTPSEFIGSVNLCRRHLSDDQRVMIAARLTPHITRDLAERQLSSRIKPGEQRNREGRNQFTKREPGDTDSSPGAESCPPATNKDANRQKRENSTRGKLAKQAGVSHHKADLAVRVAKAATKPEIEAVIAGKKTLAAADREIKERLGEKGILPASRKARKPVEHPFKATDDFEHDCLASWINLVEKKFGVAEKSRARDVFREIFSAEEKSEKAAALPAKPDAEPATPSQKAGAKDDKLAGVINPASLWGKPLPSNRGNSGV